MADTNSYLVLSGEGENGTWQMVETTARGIKQLLTKERCNGDRWATAFTDIYEMADGGYAAHDIETGEVRQVPHTTLQGKTMKFEVTTKADRDMGNEAITIEADTPEAAAAQYDVRACDYFCDNAESHVGEPETIIVEDEDGNVTRIETTYK